MHESSHPLYGAVVPDVSELHDHLAVAVERELEEELLQKNLLLDIPTALAAMTVVVPRSANAQEFALAGYRQVVIIWIDHW